MSDSDRRKITAYVHLFRSGDFDAIRAMLADDVKLDLVNRLQLEGRDKIGPYFTRYAEVTKWRFALGAVEGQPAMLVFDSTGPMERPAHFVLIDWSESRIVGDPRFPVRSLCARSHRLGAARLKVPLLDQRIDPSACRVPAVIPDDFRDGGRRRKPGVHAPPPRAAIRA